MNPWTLADRAVSPPGRPTSATLAGNTDRIMTKRTTIYLVRHGQSVGNTARLHDSTVVVSDPGGTDLTSLGVQQATQLAQTLAAIHFDAIFASDSRRTQQTAEIIATPRQSNIITTPMIRESKIRQTTDGETYAEAADRLITFLRKVTATYPGGTILVVTHGALLRAFLIKLSYGTNDELPSGSIENTGYVVVEKRDGVEFLIKEVHGVNRKLA